MRDEEFEGLVSSWERLVEDLLIGLLSVETEDGILVRADVKPILDSINKVVNRLRVDRKGKGYVLVHGDWEEDT